MGIDTARIDHTLVAPPGQFTNCKLQRVDFLRRPRASSTQAFDFVRVSRMNGRLHSWEDFLYEARRVLKPGGFLEVYDISRHHTMHEYHPWESVPMVFQSAGDLLHKPFVDGRQVRELLERIGFINVTEERKCISIDDQTQLGQSIIKTLLLDVEVMQQILNPLDHERAKRHVEMLQSETKFLSLE